MLMRGALWLLLVTSCWTRAPEPAGPKPNAASGARHVTCNQYWAHIEEVSDAPDDIRTYLPLTPEDCAEYERFTEEQRHCVVSSATIETLVLCAIADPQQRAEAQRMQPAIKRAWPGTATLKEVLDQTKGCALQGIQAQRPDWRTKAGVLVGFALRDATVLRDPKKVIATLAPSTWTCIATEPSGRCEELQRRCGPNASPE